MSTATQQRNPEVLKEYSFLLRAVATVITATDMLYEAKRLLVEPDTDTGRAANQSVCRLVALMLGLPEAEPDLTERVLRNLP